MPPSETTKPHAYRDVIDECRRLQEFFSRKQIYPATEWCLRDAAEEIERLRSRVDDLEKQIHNHLSAAAWR